MNSIYIKDINFNKMKKKIYNPFSDNSFYVDEENNKFYKIFQRNLKSLSIMEKKLDEIEKLNKSYISNPSDIIYNSNSIINGYTQKLIRGNTLRELINCRNLLEYLKDIITVSKNLEDLHNCNAVVGDIGFHNIMIDENGEPKFIDIDSISTNDIKSKTVSLLLSNYYGRKNKDVEIGENSDNIGLYLSLFKVIFGRELAVIANDTYLHEICSCPILADLYPVYKSLTRRNEVIPNVPYLHKVLKNYDNS